MPRLWIDGQVDDDIILLSVRCGMQMGSDGWDSGLRKGAMIMRAKGVELITRTLRDGKTFDDYRKAWYHTHGFGIPTKMLTVVNLFNPREIISIGIMKMDDIEQLPSVLHIDVEERLANPLDDIVEDTIVRQFGIIASEDDFSMAGEIPVKPTTVDGEEVKYSDLEEAMGIAAAMFAEAFKERDRGRREKAGDGGQE